MAYSQQFDSFVDIVVVDHIRRKECLSVCGGFHQFSNSFEIELKSSWSETLLHSATQFIFIFSYLVILERLFIFECRICCSEQCSWFLWKAFKNTGICCRHFSQYFVIFSGKNACSIELFFQQRPFFLLPTIPFNSYILSSCRNYIKFLILKLDYHGAVATPLHV